MCRLLHTATVLVLVNLAGLHAGGAGPLPVVSRKEAIATARQFAEHQWTCKPANRQAACVKNFSVQWKDNQAVVGVAYDWGGMDTLASFDAKLAQGLAAGSHKKQGVTACTTGIDCSGLVSLAWGQSQKFGTGNIQSIAVLVSGDIRHDLKPGDALNKPGSHIVLFDSYNPDGTINVYEASGSASRVVRTRNHWIAFDGYKAVRYLGLSDP